MEAVLIAQDSYLTRFAANFIHQNVGEADARLNIRAAIGGKVGCSSTNRLSSGEVAAAVRRAVEIARLQQDNPDWQGLPAPPVAAAGLTVENVDPETRAAGALRRAEGVAGLIRQAAAAKLDAAGSFSTGVQEVCVANSEGASAYFSTSRAEFNTVVAGASGSGYAARAAWSVGAIDPSALGAVAIEKALASRNPVPVEPGEYTVILESPAVADLLTFAAFLGFSALANQEGRSFMTGRLGQQVMHPSVTLWDDGQDPAGLPIPFDFEGVPKRRAMLIEKGVARGFVHDSSTAGREGTVSTGHALPAPNTFGPLPLNLFMASGSASLQELIASTERGILVTRFHYTNPVHPVKLVITGMTRDGTFLIEDGRITRPVKNMRFTESVPRTLSEVTGITRERSFQPVFFGGAMVPAVRVAKFTFTGTTEF